MHFYPSYKLADVLEMSAFSFFTLLLYLYKIKAEEGLENIAQISVPYMDKSDSKRIISSYQRTAIDIIEVEETNLDDLREAFNVHRSR